MKIVFYATFRIVENVSYQRSQRTLDTEEMISAQLLLVNLSYTKLQLKKIVNIGKLTSDYY